MTQFEFETEQAAWEYYLNLDSHHFEEKQHNNIYTDAFEAGAEWKHSRLVEKACQYLQKVLGSNEETQDLGDLMLMDLIADFRREMEE